MGAAAVFALATSSAEAQTSGNEGPPAPQTDAQPGGSSSAGAKPTQAPGRNLVEGRVLSASQSQVLLKNQADQKQISLNVHPSTPVVIGGLHKSVKDLQPGMDVHAAYQMVNGQPEAVEIQVQPLAPGEKEYQPGSSGASQSGNSQPNDVTGSQPSGSTGSQPGNAGGGSGTSP